MTQNVQTRRTHFLFPLTLWLVLAGSCNNCKQWVSVVIVGSPVHGSKWCLCESTHALKYKYTDWISPLCTRSGSTHWYSLYLIDRTFSTPPILQHSSTNDSFLTYSIENCDGMSRRNILWKVVCSACWDKLRQMIKGKVIIDKCQKKKTLEDTQ